MPSSSSPFFFISLIFLVPNGCESLLLSDTSLPSSIQLSPSTTSLSPSSTSLSPSPSSNTPQKKGDVVATRHENVEVYRVVKNAKEVVTAPKPTTPKPQSQPLLQKRTTITKTVELIPQGQGQHDQKQQHAAASAPKIEENKADGQRAQIAVASSAPRTEAKKADDDAFSMDHDFSTNSLIRQAVQPENTAAVIQPASISRPSGRLQATAIAVDRLLASPSHHEHHKKHHHK